MSSRGVNPVDQGSEQVAGSQALVSYGPIVSGEQVSPIRSDLVSGDWVGPNGVHVWSPDARLVETCKRRTHLAEQIA